MSKETSSDASDTAAVAAVSCAAIVGGPIAAAFILGAVFLWSGFFSGLAGWQLYQWFIRSQFEQAPNLGGWHIAGILMLLHLGISNSTSSTDKKSVGEQLIIGLITSPLTALFVVFGGWLFAKMAGLI